MSEFPTVLIAIDLVPVVSTVLMGVEGVRSGQYRVVPIPCEEFVMGGPILTPAHPRETRVTLLHCRVCNWPVVFLGPRPLARSEGLARRGGAG